MDNIMWYKTPTDKWNEGLPIGNGRLAGMVIHEESTDRIALNHEWIWRGVNRQRDNKITADKLQEVRDYLLNGDFKTGTKLANDYFACGGGISDIKCRVDSYQPAGDLSFTYEDTNFMERKLDLNSGIASAVRKNSKNESCYLSSAYVHCVDNYLVCNWNSTKGEFSGKLYYSRVEDNDAITSTVYTNKEIIFDCEFVGGTSYKTIINYYTDGNIIVADNEIIISNATYLYAFANIATSTKNIETEIKMYPLPKSGFDIVAVERSHIEKFFSVKNRMTIEIDIEKNDMPTDERINNLKNGESDSELALLYYNFGKYLLICSSICGELPANLQGKWNDMINPPWDSDYHFDINLQMNYWAAEQVNMGECSGALLKYVESYIPHAKKAAMDIYGCRGVWLPIQSDAWGIATAESYGWAVWIGAAAWIAQNFWKHYIYSMNKDFLLKRAYPFFLEVVNFYEDYLIKDENGTYQIVPSQSPENRFAGTGDFPVSIGISSAMDVQLAYDAFTYAIKSAETLNIDSKNIEEWKKIRANLPDFKIGSDGRLLEWDIDREEVEPSHRHLSHLYGLYPSDIFNTETRKPQYDACIKSLDYRLSHGGGHTGWSRAWVACINARLGFADKFWGHLNSLIKDFATISLLNLHPPRIYQIDGNLGAVAAVIESICACWNGKVRLLQSIPEEWAKGGKISNTITEGGHLLSFEWKDGKVINIDVVLKSDYPLTVVYNGIEKVYTK